MNVNIIQAIEDQHLLGFMFKDPSTWGSWRTFLKAIFGLPMDRGERKLFRDCTGLRNPPGKPIKEAFVIAGRRSGKSFTSALIAIYLACFKDWKAYLSPGEKGWIFVIAVDKLQARIIKNYMAAALRGSKALKGFIQKETQEEIYLKNNIVIAIKTASFRSIRGYTLLAAVLEELAFWRSEDSANPDKEVLTAVRPALSTIPESILIGISTPYSRTGVLWDQFKAAYGKAGGPLIWKAETKVMNPAIDKSLVKQAMQDDPEAARAEWLGEWRTDISAFLPQEVVESCVVTGRYELPKIDAEYFAFVDPSGGRQDSFTLAIAHREEGGKIVLDAIREHCPPLKPENVVSEHCKLLKTYKVDSVTSDKYAGEWVTDAYRRNDVSVNASKLTASELYLELLPMISNGSAELLDNTRLVSQLAGLERRTRSGGKDLITHYPGGHDDVANAVAGALILASRRHGAFAGIVDHDVYPDDYGDGIDGDLARMIAGAMGRRGE